MAVGLVTFNGGCAASNQIARSARAPRFAAKAMNQAQAGTPAGRAAIAAQAATTSKAGAHRRSRVRSDLSSGPAGCAGVPVGGRLAPVVVAPGMSISVFLQTRPLRNWAVPPNETTASRVDGMLRAPYRG